MDGTAPDFAGGHCTEPGLDPETWFVDDASDARIAKSACALCIHGPNGNDNCFAWFLKVEEQDGYFAYGIYGGRDAAYRQNLLDRKKYLNETGETPRPDEFWGYYYDERD